MKRGSKDRTPKKQHKARAVPSAPPSVRKKSRALSASTDDAEPDHPLQEWMIPATDSQGHSAKVFTRCPPKYKHQIASILLKHRYPWDTESDLVRVAVHRLLVDIDKDMKDPEITSGQAQLNALVELASRQMEYAHFKETLEKLAITVDDLLKNAAVPMARKMVDAVQEQIEHFEEDYWRDRYRKEIVERFRPLVGGGKKER